MSEIRRHMGPVQWFALLVICGVFVADFGFDAFAKEVPWFAYAVLGLLALGVEARALRRLVIQAVRVAANLPPESKEKDDAER